MGATAQRLQSDVGRWLARVLRRSCPTWGVEVLDSSNAGLEDLGQAVRTEPASALFDFLETSGATAALLRRGTRTRLALVMCQVEPITLREIGPLLIYGRLLSPFFVALVSPGGLSRSLSRFVNSRDGSRVLRYVPGRRLRLIRWDRTRKQPYPSSVLLHG
jgi:hypothetical protein